MQRLLRRAGRAGGQAPVLEINPRHALIQAWAGQVDEAVTMAEAARTLLDLAKIQDGDPPGDPGRFARHVTAMLARAFGAG